MALNEEFSFIYQDTSTDILCGPLQQLEDPAVLMLLQPHEQQQHTTDSDVHNLQFDDSSGPISSLSSPFLTLSQTTNDDNTNKKRKSSAPSPIITTTTTTANSETSPETCWASPTLETTPNTTTSSSNTSSTQRR